MLDQNTFTETIRAVQDIIRTSAEPMTREEILSYFKDMDLNAQQEEMVLEFLSTPHDDPQPEENEPETKEAEYEEIAEKEETKELLSALRQVKHPYGQVFWLLAYEEMSFKEIGEIFDKSENWARVNYFRAKTKIRKVIEDENNKNNM